MKYLELLRVILTVSKDKLPGVLQILDQILTLLSLGNPSADSLQVVEPTAEECALEGQLAEALTAEGSQAVFDGSRLRKLAALAAQYGPTILTLIKMFSGAAG